MSESLLVQLRKGVLDMCVLALLARQDGYAYDIASRLAEDIGMGEGTIYPLMRRMQADGLVKTYLAEFEQRAAAQILPAHPGRPRRARRAKDRMDQLRGVGCPGAGRQSNIISENRRRRAMTRAEFLSILHERLRGLPAPEIEELMDDYDSHFAEGLAAGRSEAEIAAALGDPARLARELRAEAGLRRWESARTPGNFYAAMIGFLALIAVDFMFLLPLLGALALAALAVGLVMLGLCVAGLVLMMKLFSFHGLSLGYLTRILSGIGLLGLGVGGGALLVMAVDYVVRLLARFARLHYTLLQRSEAT